MCLHYVFVCPGGEEMYGGVGFGGGPGGGQRDEGREQRGTETKTLQQEGQRLVSCPSQNTQTSTCGCRMSINSICSECVVRLCLCGRAASGGEEQHVDQRHQRSPTSVRTRGGGGSRGWPLQENLHHLRTWTHLWEDVDTHTDCHMFCWQGEDVCVGPHLSQSHSFSSCIPFFPLICFPISLIKLDHIRGAKSLSWWHIQTFLSSNRAVTIGRLIA